MSRVTLQLVWQKRHIHVLFGTGLELHPQFGCPGYWYVVDGNAPDTALAGPLDLRWAKKRAEEIVIERQSQSEREAAAVAVRKEALGAELCLTNEQIDNSRICGECGGLTPMRKRHCEFCGEVS